MKKYNIFLVIISCVLTIGSIVGWATASKINTIYGSPASSPPFILGLITIPAIMWFITYLTSEKKNAIIHKSISKNSKTYRITDQKDPLIINLEISINKFDEEIVRLKEEGELLNRSLAQDLLDERTHDTEIDRLNKRYYYLINKKKSYETRLRAIINLKSELLDLEDLCNRGIISVYKKEIKRKELIDNEIVRLTY
jgi:hypothetical protein